MPQLTFATWNVALPVAPHRRAAMQVHIDRVQPDILVLTETHDGFKPGHPFSHSSTAGRDGSHKAEHRWVTIWSWYQLAPLETSDPQRSVAARVTPTSGDPFIVFGSVLPWIGSTWRGLPNAKGAAFRAAVSMQGGDWIRLRTQYPDDEFMILGDLNQDLVTPRYYGSQSNRFALEAEIQNAGLTVLTGGENDPVRRLSAPCACIDHICARSDSRWHFVAPDRWPDVPVPERWLSDHFGVSVTARM